MKLAIDQRAVADVGSGRDRARVAYARLVNGKLVCSLETS